MCREYFKLSVDSNWRLKIEDSFLGLYLLKTSNKKFWSTLLSTQSHYHLHFPFHSHLSISSTIITIIIIIIIINSFPNRLVLLTEKCPSTSFSDCNLSHLHIRSDHISCFSSKWILSYSVPAFSAVFCSCFLYNFLVANHFLQPCIFLAFSSPFLSIVTMFPQRRIILVSMRHPNDMRMMWFRKVFRSWLFPFSSLVYILE